MTSKIRFVTDSVCDIPDDLVRKWDIVVVPCYVNYGNNSYADDGVELRREEYYRELGSMKETPTTAAMPPDVARQYIEPIVDDADHIIVITTPANLSAIHNSMRLALEGLKLPKERYSLIDSRSLSLGIAFQVLIGAEVAAETGDLQQTLDAIQRVRENTRVYATIGGMEFLRRSGRVSWAAAGIAGLLNIKPVIEVHEGEVHAKARVRTFSRALDKMAELAAEHAPVDKIGILHINNPEGLEEIRSRLQAIIPDHARVIEGMIGPTLGTHIGPGSVGVVTVSESWKRS